MAEQLNERHNGQRARGAYADAADRESLDEAFAGVDTVMVASSTAAYVQNVAEAAVAARIDYLDINFAAGKVDRLRAMAREIEECGCCFITDGGFHPGLPAALIRYVGQGFDRLEKARVGSVIKIDWAGLNLAQSTIEEFVAEFIDFQAPVFRDGRWQEGGWMGLMKPPTMNFGPEFGRQYVVPMFLEEMRTIPDMFPGMVETGFYVGGFNRVTDWLVSPLVMAVLKVAPRRGLPPMARLFHWSLARFSRPPCGTMLKVEARGRQNDRPLARTLTLFHRDGYVFTAVPVVATLLQLLDGTIGRPGLHLQAHIVEPGRLLSDMEKMGIEVCEKE
jgi:saccharopine dehydrogenase (NAD+, L-lysine-forming)